MEEEFLISEHTCSPGNYGLSFSEERPVEYLFSISGAIRLHFPQPAILIASVTVSKLSKLFFYSSFFEKSSTESKYFSVK